MEKNLLIIQKIEADNKIFSFSSPSGQMLWPLIRNSLFQILNKRGQHTQASSISRTQKLFRKLKHLLHSFLDIRFSIPDSKCQVDIVFFQHNYDLRAYKNKLIDPCFFMASLFAKNSIVFYEGGVSSAPEGCPYKTYDLQPCFRFLNFISKLIPSYRHAKTSKNMAQYISDTVKDITGNKFSRNDLLSLQKMIINFSRLTFPYRTFFHFLWRRVQPKIIFYTVGYYGTDSMGIRAAKALGIKTVEIQHGLIYSNHFAYNFHTNACRNIEFIHNYQEVIFIFGKWFKDKMNTPSPTYILGWPYHSLQSKRLKKKKPEDQYILFLPTGLSFTSFYEMAHKFIKRHPKKTILLRPHPIDYDIADKIKERNTDKQILIHYDGDLYSALEGATFVIGDMSTALFTAYECYIPVYSFSNELTKDFLGEDNPFPQFSTLDELDTLISQPYEKKYEFYAENWQENLYKYLYDTLGKKRIEEITTADIYKNYVEN